MATALPLLGVQYPSAIQRSPLPRVRREACGLNFKGETRPDRLSSTRDYAAAFARFCVGARANESRVLVWPDRLSRAALILNRWAAERVTR